MDDEEVEVVDTADVVDEEDDDDVDDNDDEEEEPVAVSAVELPGKTVDDEQQDDEESLMDAEDPTEHTEDVDEHTENADEHTENADEHTENADEHTENADEHNDNADEHNENADEHNEIADEDDESQATEEDATSQSSLKTPKAASRGGKKRTPTRSSAEGSSVKKVRAPSVKGLTIPFRTVKKAMKLDPDIPIVQNEAAIMTTMAAELFLKSLAKQSHRNAKNRGRNTIRYEDVAEARTNSSALAFLETLLP
jgi:histone H3/H4